MKKNKKIYLSSLTIIIISAGIAMSVIFCAAFFSSLYTNEAFKSTYTASEQTVSQTAIAVEDYLYGLQEKLKMISRNISDCTSTDEVNEKTSVASKLESDIFAVMVYDTDGNLLACGSEEGSLKKGYIKNLSFDRELFSSSTGFAVTAPHVQTLFENQYPWVVTIACRQSQPLFGGDVYIAMDFHFSNIAKYIDNIGIGTHGYCYIIDGRGSIIYHPQQQMIFAGLKDENTNTVFKKGDGLYREKNTIYTLNTVKNSSWRVVGVSYNDEIEKNVSRLTYIVILFSLLCTALISSAVSMMFSKSITAPVKRLVHAMQSFEEQSETYKYTADTSGVAELQTLSKSFEHMVRMIQELMEKVRREEITLRKTELKALQAQINPHFLYNTLDSIQWMCERSETEDAVKMVNALAKLFRISISRGKELIPVKDELRHAQSYLIIQSFRYKDQFSYTFDIDESIEDCLCNKITLQPLIENAIYHGIDRMVDEGKIKISAKADGDDIIFTVEDNGVGMTDEQCRKIMQKEKSDSGGIGVKNVNDRLKIYFGEKYGITIKSELDSGTCVTVRLPQIRKEPENEV